MNLLGGPHDRETNGATGPTGEMAERGTAWFKGSEAISARGGVRVVGFAGDSAVVR